MVGSNESGRRMTMQQQTINGMAKAGGGWQQERLGAVWHQGNRRLHNDRQRQKRAADNDATANHHQKR